jgi:hypothetical protein
MDPDVLREYSFGKFKLEDLKTTSWTCREMGLSYHFEGIKLSSHKTCYQFYVTATEEQWENLRKLLNIRRRINGTY